MWLWRVLKEDPTFPRPFTMGQGELRLFDDDELDAYDEARKEVCVDGLLTYGEAGHR